GPAALIELPIAQQSVRIRGNGAVLEIVQFGAAQSPVPERHLVDLAHHAVGINTDVRKTADEHGEAVGRGRAGRAGPGEILTERAIDRNGSAAGANHQRDVMPAAIGNWATVDSLLVLARIPDIICAVMEKPGTNMALVHKQAVTIQAARKIGADNAIERGCGS